MPVKFQPGYLDDINVLFSVPKRKKCKYKFQLKLNWLMYRDSDKNDVCNKYLT